MKLIDVFGQEKNLLEVAKFTDFHVLGTNPLCTLGGSGFDEEIKVSES